MIRERLAATPEGYRYPLGRVLAVYGALMVTLFFAALDQTIVVTALPRIVADVGGLTSYSWIVTAYMLALTVTVPLYGKLVDVYGARRPFLGAVALFLLGSGLCALAQTMPQLVAFRVASGRRRRRAGAHRALDRRRARPAARPRPLPGADRRDLRAAAIAGPPLGGLIADNTSWRWIFIVNLPLGVIAFCAIAVAMPPEATRREHSIDWLGAAALAAGTASLLLALVWGGHQYPWSSPEVVGAFVGAGVLLAAFAWIERRVPETILPFEILRGRTAAVGTAALFLIGMTILGTVVYVPLFVQGVLGRSATSSGVIVIPFMLAAVIASVFSGWWVSRSGRYKVVAVAGLAVLAGGLALVWRMDAATGAGEVARNAVVAGVGLGLAMQVLIVAVQNTVPLSTMGSATALVHFSRSIGGTLGVTVMGVIAARELPRGADVRGPIPKHLPLFVRQELAEAIRPAFLFAACVCLVALALVAIGLREEPLRRSFEEEPVRSVL